MKKIFFVFAALLLPSLALAHGGVEKHIGDVVVFLKQVPISPLTGENVKLYFALSRLDTNEALKNAPVTVTLTDTFYGDESKDKVIDRKKLSTDMNGDFDLAYTFDKENYFDVDVSFKDPKTGETESTGFLIQPRSTGSTTPVAPAEPSANYAWMYLVLGLAVGAGIVSSVRRK